MNNIVNLLLILLTINYFSISNAQGKTNIALKPDTVSHNAVIDTNITSQTEQNQKILPRFVSIKSNKVNARTGPNIHSTIEWIFVQKGEPVAIIAEYEQWRKIKDFKGDNGWVHSSVLSSKRFVIVIGEEIIPMFTAPNQESKVIAKLAPEVRCMLKKCMQGWCKVNCQEYQGWVKAKLLWGIYESETK